MSMQLISPLFTSSLFAFDIATLYSFEITVDYIFHLHPIDHGIQPDEQGSGHRHEERRKCKQAAVMSASDANHP